MDTYVLSIFRCGPHLSVMEEIIKMLYSWAVAIRTLDKRVLPTRGCHLSKQPIPVFVRIVSLIYSDAMHDAPATLPAGRVHEPVGCGYRGGSAGGFNTAAVGTVFDHLGYRCVCR
jgi:hypothetical protein